MEKRELQDLLNQPYKPENWQKIVRFVFPNVSILEKPKTFPIQNEKIKRFSQIGNVRLNDGKNLALFELLLADNVNLQRNRVELNNEVAQFIDQEQIHGVLSVFEQGTDEYRFTFSAKSTEFDEEESDFVAVRTDTKRYTYVLGKNETCKTPAKRFYELSENKDQATIQSIQKAFSVEKLSKEFFDKYKKQFEKFWNYIAKEESLSKHFTGEDKEKDIRDFTKKLLGRIVFLHYLQKKGWMGCDSTKKGWVAGDKQFMQNLFLNYANKEHFHSKCLTQLFFDTLNNGDRKNQVFSCEGLEGNLNNSKIPYLNGGLFDTGNTISKKIDFPVEYFENLLDFFGQYNFTIDENDPNDHEVGIDPEMLGHIFENLLEDNKDKGAFYTPKIIVKYMCQESLIEYLSTKLNATTDSDKRIAVEKLIREQLAQELNDLDLITEVAQALLEVKICDPAIGSGAFPMGILNEIFQIVESLYNLQPDAIADVWEIDSLEWQPHIVKKKIIQNSIYGVDIESGAVDIARLRFWLALVVDEQEPLPLPNLDYKIMQGNSLLESFEGIDLSTIDQASISGNVDFSSASFSGNYKRKNNVDIQQLMSVYFSASSPNEKKQISKDINQFVIDFIHERVESEKKDIEDSLKEYNSKIENKRKNLSNPDAIEKLEKSKDYKSKLKLEKQLNSIVDKEIKLNELIHSSDKPFFLWRLFFKDVFDKGGFDIVIANPPYISIRTKNFDKSLKSIFKEKYTLAQGQYDLYVLFLELTNSILNELGVMSYIIPQRMLSNESFELARRFVMNEIPVVNYVDVSMPFDNANVEANIMIGSKKSNKKNIESYVYESKSKRFKFLCNVDRNSIDKMPFYIFPFVYNNETLDVLFKIQEKNHKTLEEFVEITRGFECGYSDDSITSEVTPYKLIKSNSIKPFKIQESEILYCTPDFSNVSKFKKKEVFTKVPKLITKFVANKIEFSIDQVGYFNTNSVYNANILEGKEKYLLYLLAVLNSKLITFWFNTAFLNSDNLFPHIQKNQLNAIPIVITDNKKVFLEINDLVEFILANNNFEDKYNELNKLIYEVYSISDEDILHIEKTLKK